MRKDPYLKYVQGTGIVILQRIVNQASEDSTSVIIARALLEHRKQLNELKMEDIAAQYPISQAGITRFIKKLGFQSFNEFKIEMARSEQLFSSRGGTD